MVLLIIFVILCAAAVLFEMAKRSKMQELEEETERIRSELAYLNRKVEYPPDLTPPPGPEWPDAKEILSEAHILIGGTTGSGKSVLLNSLLYALLKDSPDVNSFIFVDLKKVELGEYAQLPNTIAYCTKHDVALQFISRAVDTMNERYREMAETGKKQWEGEHIWIIIDEMADLLQSNRLSTTALCTKIVRLGRAANIHLIAATQNPTRDDGGGLPLDIAQNFTAAIALRCRSDIESENIIGKAGAEFLPRYGKGYLWNANGIRKIDIPMVSKEDRIKRIEFWREYHDTH